jgi:type IV secretion system protein VirB10
MYSNNNSQNTGNNSYINSSSFPNSANLNPADGNGNQILSRPATPLGAGFNRNVVFVVASGVIMAFILAMYFGFQTPAATKKPGEDPSKSQKGAASLRTNPMIASLPNSYGDINRQAVPKLTPPANQVTPVIPPNPGYPPYQAGGSQAQYPRALGASYGPYGYATQLQVPGMTNQISPEEKELNDAIKSPIYFTAAGGTGQNPAANSTSAANSNNPLAAAFASGNNAQAPGNITGGLLPTGSTGASATNQSQPWGQDANGQNEKQAFVQQSRDSDFYASSQLTEARSAYEVKGGTIIPGVMISGLNSDLPGTIIAQVRENVYDSISGNYLLIPQGSRLVGTYDSKATYGQERVLVAWTRLIFPDGESLGLEGMEGYDTQGYSGYHDRVDDHTGRIVSAVLVSGFITGLGDVAQRSGNTTVVNFGQASVAGAADAAGSVGSQMAQKALNLQPTLKIDPGYRFNIIVNKDFVLKPYEG